MRPFTSWSALHTVPCRSRFQCSAASRGQNSGLCCRPLPCLDQEQRSSQTLRLCSGVWSVAKSGGQWREDRMLTCGDESRSASETLVRKPTLKQSKPSWMKQAPSRQPRDDSFQSIMYEKCKAAVETSTAISYIGNFMRRAKGGERRRRRITSGMGREERAMETRGADSGASPHAEAQWKAMALRGVWQARK